MPLQDSGCWSTTWDTFEPGGSTFVACWAKTLERFDMLIESTHHLLCLDGSGAMRSYVKGPHIPLVAPVRQRTAGCLNP